MCLQHPQRGKHFENGARRVGSGQLLGSPAPAMPSHVRTQGQGTVLNASEPKLPVLKRWQQLQRGGWLWLEGVSEGRWNSA